MCNFTLISIFAYDFTDLEFDFTQSEQSTQVNVSHYYYSLFNHISTVRTIVFIIICAISTADAYSQIISKGESPKITSDSIRKAFDKEPYFGLYKDNYFVFGTSVGPRPTKQNSNVKFQISVAQRLTKSTLPFGTYLYLFYTQKAFWNVLENSMPFHDLNFNPGIGLAKPLFAEGTYIGKAIFQIEHESNGRDSIQSRSWNRISFGASIIIDRNMMVHGKYWIPIVDGENNKNITKYVGILQGGINYISDNGRFFGSLTLVKRAKWKPSFNTTIEFGYKISRNDNQYLFLQYYNGYGEGLLDYRTFRSELRVGMVIRPKYFSDF